MIALETLEKSDNILDRQEFSERMKVYVSWQKDQLKMAIESEDKEKIETERHLLQVFTERLSRFNIYNQKVKYACLYCQKRECVCEWNKPEEEVKEIVEPVVEVKQETFDNKVEKLF